MFATVTELRARPFRKNHNTITVLPSMLKRRRPSSPLPSSPSIALIPDSPMDMSHQPIKRRRMGPPVLDGEWGMRRGEESDEEDDDELVSQECTSTGLQDSSISSTGEYKDANSFLHDLHALHQHRLMFAPAALPSHRSSYLPTSYSMSPVGKELSQRPANLAYQQRHKYNVSAIPEPGDSNMDLEVERVMERYEDTNKLLGALFLSRRRELGTDDK